MEKQLSQSELEELNFLERLRQKNSRKIMRLEYLRTKRAAFCFRYGKKDLPSAFYDFLDSHL